MSDRTLVNGKLFLPYGVELVLVALVAILFTFALASSTLNVTQKLTGFSIIIFAYLACSVSIHLLQTRKNRRLASDPSAAATHVERGLAALDEANEFFTGVLKTADAFRLISNRIADLLAFRGLALYLLDESRNRLAVTEATGSETEYLKGITIDLDEALPGKAFTEKKFAIDHTLSKDPTQAFHTSVAIPLINNAEPFAVLQLFFGRDIDLRHVDVSIFEAIGCRVAPFILSSIAFEQTLQRALTDAITDLPNERAFSLVLETQTAEALRSRDKRALTILALDVKNFDELNRRFGHAAGDRILNFVARSMQGSVRQMDFFAKGVNDEFLAILPTASKETAYDVINRLNTELFGRSLKLTSNESVEIELNIGWATFGEDAETPAGLLQLARSRKDQLKFATQPNVLLFPQEVAGR